MAQVNGVELHVVEAGPEDGPLVILLHGFPDFWWGWRHQMEPLVKAGYRVVVPDQRGYNLSSKPKGVSSYHVDTLAADVAALLIFITRLLFVWPGTIGAASWRGGRVCAIPSEWNGWSSSTRPIPTYTRA